MHSKIFITSESPEGVEITIFNCDGKSTAIVFYPADGRSPEWTTLGCENPLPAHSPEVGYSVLDHTSPLYEHYKKTYALECFHSATIEKMLSMATWEIIQCDGFTTVLFSHGRREMVSVKFRPGSAPEFDWHFWSSHSVDQFVSPELHDNILYRATNVYNWVPSQ